jgi:lipopolysaccharide export system protein LptA
MKLPEINHTLVLLCMISSCNLARAEHADRDKPVHLEADQVSIDDAKQVSTFEGKVLLSQGTLSIRGDKMVVVQDKNGFSHGTATGQLANFRQKRDGLDEYVEGFGERIEYDTQNETVDFYGQARMTRKLDEVRGDHISYNSKTEIFKVQSTQGNQADSATKGRVRVILQPKGTAGTAVKEPLPITPSDTLSSPKSTNE